MDRRPPRPSHDIYLHGFWIDTHPVANAAYREFGMRLRARSPQHVRVADLDLVVDFADNQETRTEISAKFRRAGLSAELDTAGFTLTHWWTDAQGDFALTLASVR